MNERIKQLAEQAGFQLDELPDSVFIPLDKFAELIVQEVMAGGDQPGTPEFEAKIGRILTAKYDTTKVVSYQQGGGAAAYNAATGGVTPLIVPGNTGQPLAPLPPGFVLDNGGPTQPASGNF